MTLRWLFIQVSTWFVLTFGVLSSLLAAEPGAKGIEFFESKIRPILVEHCYECHSSTSQTQKKLKGSLLLDSKDGILAGGDTGPSIVPGKATESLIIRALHYRGDLKMPPGDPHWYIDVRDLHMACWFLVGFGVDGKGTPERSGR